MADMQIFKAMAKDRKDPIEFMDGVLVGFEATIQSLIEQSAQHDTMSLNAFQELCRAELLEVQNQIESEVLRDMEQHLN